MKQVLFIISLFVSVGSFAQRQSVAEVASKILDIALVDKDTFSLKQYLHDSLSYGHSNGWIETKQELIRHLFNGKLSYSGIDSRILSVKNTGDMAIIRTESKIRYVLDGKEGELKLHVMQVWVYNKNRWQLIGRQSAKLN